MGTPSIQIPPWPPTGASSPQPGRTFRPCPANNAHLPGMGWQNVLNRPGQKGGHRGFLVMSLLDVYPAPKIHPSIHHPLCNHPSICPPVHISTTNSFNRHCLHSSPSFLILMSLSHLSIHSPTLPPAPPSFPIPSSTPLHHSHLPSSHVIYVPSFSQCPSCYPSPSSPFLPTTP